MSAKTVDLVLVVLLMAALLWVATMMTLVEFSGDMRSVANEMGTIKSELCGIREELRSARVAPEQTCEVGDE
jgi:hypothetical protein